MVQSRMPNRYRSCEQLETRVPDRKKGRKRQMRRCEASVSCFNVIQKVVRGSGGRDKQFARSREPGADGGDVLVLFLNVGLCCCGSRRMYKLTIGLEIAQVRLRRGNLLVAGLGC
jgi:hypothetical protein